MNYYNRFQNNKVDEKQVKNNQNNKVDEKQVKNNLECVYSPDSPFDQLYQAFVNSWDEYLIVLGVCTTLFILYRKIKLIRFLIFISNKRSK